MQLMTENEERATLAELYAMRSGREVVATPEAEASGLYL